MYALRTTMRRLTIIQNVYNRHKSLWKHYQKTEKQYLVNAGE